MRAVTASIVCAITCWFVAPLRSQVVVSGRVLSDRFPGSPERVPLAGIRCFANLAGPEGEARSFRTWETEPVGWYRLAGAAGAYTIVFSSPEHCMRPIVLTNTFTFPGETLDRNVAPCFDFHSFFEGAWDDKRASRYFQPFVARGTSVTQVGFRLAHDGVDGLGPGAQNLLVSIQRRGAGTPDTWEQVGPAVPVLAVDAGGPKNPIWSCGWNSGEVPLEPGGTYAVQVRAENPEGTFQAFWRPIEGGAGDCYRIGPAGTNGFRGRALWLAVSADGDGLVIPYNKRVHRTFQEFAGFRSTWAQVYVARGKSLCSAILFAAVGGAQPPLSRQRVRVRVREGGPGGRICGIEKIAIGNGIYTGDASWGTFGVAFAPGEVPLEPGRTYAIEFESIEHYETLHGFVNIKGQVSDDRPGFNPYRKVPPDAYEQGTAFDGGTKPVDFDLDLQVIEYVERGEGWEGAVDAENLLANGDMEAGTFDAAKPEAGRPDAWRTFALDPATTFHYVADGPAFDNRIARVIGGGFNATSVDGGYAQRVDGLSRLDAYRLSGRVRSSWPLDPEHACLVGYDPTGQIDDAKAPTIVWTAFPVLYGRFVPYASPPIRPSAGGAISVWLRAHTSMKADYPFKGDFDDFALRRVKTGVPGAGEGAGEGGAATKR